MQSSLKKHSCNQCDSSFDRPYKLKQHILFIHDNIKPHTCKVENCNKSYSSKSHLDRHLTESHLKSDSEVLFSCPTCFKVFANRQNLKKHIKIAHSSNTRLTCEICKLEFRKKNQLSAHMFTHTGVKSYSCELCPKDFISLYDKKRHMRFHKTHVCEHCDTLFNQWSKYLKHRTEEHKNKEYICNECDRKFKERIHIVRHVKVHMTIPKKKVFLCPYDNCQRSYSRNSNLKQHILVKHMKILHECTICKAQLTSKARLNIHIESHSKPKLDNLPVKTLKTGRKERKDKGVYKMSTAVKLSGLTTNLDNVLECDATDENNIYFQSSVDEQVK